MVKTMISENGLNFNDLEKEDSVKILWVLKIKVISC